MLATDVVSATMAKWLEWLMQVVVVLVRLSFAWYRSPCSIVLVGLTFIASLSIYIYTRPTPNPLFFLLSVLQELSCIARSPKPRVYRPCATYCLHMETLKPGRRNLLPSCLLFALIAPTLRPNSFPCLQLTSPDRGATLSIWHCARCISCDYLDPKSMQNNSVLMVLGHYFADFGGFR